MGEEPELDEEDLAGGAGMAGDVEVAVEVCDLRTQTPHRLVSTMNCIR